MNYHDMPLSGLPAQYESLSPLPDFIGQEPGLDQGLASDADTMRATVHETVGYDDDEADIVSFAGHVSVRAAIEVDNSAELAPFNQNEEPFQLDRRAPDAQGNPEVHTEPFQESDSDEAPAETGDVPPSAPREAAGDAQSNPLESERQEASAVDPTEPEPVPAASEGGGSDLVPPNDIPPPGAGEMPDDDGEGENDGIETAPYTWGGPFPVRHETEAGVVERTITFDYETSELVTDGGTIQVHPDVADPEQTERDLTRTVASQLVDRQVTRWDTAMNTAHDVQVASDVFGDAIGYYHYQSGDDTYQEVPLSITNAAAAELAETMSAQPGQGLYAHINLSEFPGNGPDGRLLLAPDHVESTVLPPDVSVNQDADPTLTARIVDSAATGKQTTGWHQLGGNLLNRFGERQYLQDTETNPTLFAKRTDLRTSEEGPRPLGAGEIERAPQVAAVVSSPAMQAEAVKRGFKDGIHYIAPIVAIVNPHTMIETVFVPFQKGRPIQDISNTSYGEWVKGSELARADAVIQELRGQFEANGITPNDLNATQLLVTADAATGNLRLHLIDAEDFERRLPDPGTPNADSE